MSQHKLGFIGGGNMATALCRGFVRSGQAQSSEIIVSDRNEACLTVFNDDGYATSTDNLQVIATSRVVFLAIKPQVCSHVLREISDSVTSEHLLVSIVAGLSIDSIAEMLECKSVRIVRVMPNTPCLVSQVASAYALGPHATSEDSTLVKELLCSVGVAIEMHESKLNAVTGLSGSGPAYVFMIIEAMADGGVKMGLSRADALKLATQTVLGAAQMVKQTGQHPAQLRDSVASPGGTTIAGIHALEKGGLRATIMDAVEAATLRSQELSMN